MANQDLAKSEFSEILASVQRRFDIIDVKWTDNKSFEIKFRTQIERNCDDYNTLCDEWVDLFSEVTSTVWVNKISNTGPKIRFRKQYQCWTQVGKAVQKELLFDARRCKGTLDMKVLTDNPLTRRKNKHIRMGLNTVVKINFHHLHEVDGAQPYSFFVHNCEPLLEAPKPVIQPNDELPKRVAEMVQKGLNATPKVTNTNLSTSRAQHQKIAAPADMIENKILSDHFQAEINSKIVQQEIVQSQLQLHNIEQSLQLNHVIPIQNMDSIKLEVQPHLQQVTQVVVSAPQLDMTEPLLMCQPTLMFDPTQIIPVTAHTLPHHFVQVHSHNIHTQQGHYL